MTELQVYKFQTATIELHSSNTDKPTNVILNYQEGEAKYFSINLGKDVTLEMVALQAGSFIMGSPENEEGRNQDEKPQHKVDIARFFMSKYPITQAQYLTIMKKNPSGFKGEKKPVETVSWFDCKQFCHKLSKLTDRQFRLPSEAQWEYACRAGTTTPFYTGDTITTDLANYNGQFGYGKGNAGIARRETTDVGSFPPNAFGLYDLHGNVLEWCADSWHNNYLNAPSHSDPWEDKDAEEENSPRVLRGGSWDDTAYYCRSSVRNWCSPLVKGKLIGFRIVC